MSIYAKIYLGFIIFMTIITFIVYGLDKSFAKKDKMRIKEAALLSLSILGGAIGGYLAMIIFHHKTKHWYFMLTNILGVVLFSVIFYFLIK